MSDKDELEPNSADNSDNEYDHEDGFLAPDDEEESNCEPSDEEEYDSLDESGEEDDSDDPDYEDLDPDELREDNEKKTREILAMKALIRSYEHEIKCLTDQLKLAQEMRK